MSGFNPTRLQLARERRGLFRKELASRCGVTPQAVSNWELGVNVPALETVQRLCSELRFPEEFFSLPDLDPLPSGAATFRSRSKLTARQKNAALAAGVLARELAFWIERHFELPPVRLPDLAGHSPDVAAQVLRTEWMLGERPIINLIQVLESRGVLVFSLAQDCRELDAFSFWSGERPIVLLNMMTTAERSRHDGAHELFHLVAHKEETGKEEEEEAENFAGAFLMPHGDVYRHLPRAISLQQLIQAKRRWGVSLASLVYRLHRLSIASDWQYRTLFVELSKRGYRTSEPDPMPREGSTLLSKVFGALRTQGVTPRRVATELRWPLEQLQEFIFGLGAAMLAVDGGGDGGGAGTRDHLRLV